MPLFCHAETKHNHNESFGNSLQRIIPCIKSKFLDSNLAKRFFVIKNVFWYEKERTTVPKKRELVPRFPFNKIIIRNNSINICFIPKIAILKRLAIFRDLKLNGCIGYGHFRRQKDQPRESFRFWSKTLWDLFQSNIIRHNLNLVNAKRNSLKLPSFWVIFH